MHHASDDGPPPRFPHADRRIVLADFFAGCGGASLGFAQAGITPAVAVDSDADAAATYRHNFPAVTVIERDIRRIPADDTQLAPLRDTGTVRLFAGCAPCQPFAAHQKHATTTDHRNGLLMEFLRFIRTFEPELVFVENVAGMARRRNTHSPFHEFVRALSETHHVAHGTVTSADYGVPQIRRRLILIASTLGHIDLPPPTHGRATQQPHSTVRDWIHAVPPIAAGQQHPHIAAHRASNLSATNMTRIRATPIGGDRRDWPPTSGPTATQAPTSCTATPTAACTGTDPPQPSPPDASASATDGTATPANTAPSPPTKPPSYKPSRQPTSSSATSTRRHDK